MLYLGYFRQQAVKKNTFKKMNEQKTKKQQQNYLRKHDWSF